MTRPDIDKLIKRLLRPSSAFLQRAGLPVHLRSPDPGREWFPRFPEDGLPVDTNPDASGKYFQDFLDKNPEP